MAIVLTWEDIERVCRSLGMVRVGNSKTWRGMGSYGLFRQTYIHSHGAKSPVAKGTAKAIAKQLHFATVDVMVDYLKHL